MFLKKFPEILLQIYFLHPRLKEMKSKKIDEILTVTVTRLLIQNYFQDIIKYNLKGMKRNIQTFLLAVKFLLHVNI